MPRFNYVALDARGQEASGLLEAVSSNAAISQLRQAGYFPTSVIEEAISQFRRQGSSSTYSNRRAYDETACKKRHRSFPAQKG